VVGSKEIGLEVNGDKTTHMIMSREQNERRSRSVKIDSSSFETIEEFKHMGNFNKSIFYSGRN
jgi:hypothetical protein